MSPHPGADGFVQEELPPYFLHIDRFHQSCLLPGRTPGQVRTVVSVPRGTYPCGQPGLPSVRLTGGTCHADSTTPRQDVYSRPTSPKVFAHTQVRDPHGSAAACCWARIGDTISLATSVMVLVPVPLVQGCGVRDVDRREVVQSILFILLPPGHNGAFIVFPCPSSGIHCCPMISLPLSFAVFLTS